MKIFTGNFANLKKYTVAELVPISVAFSARYFNGCLYRPLNPDYSFLNDPQEIYTPKYYSKLKKLNISQVIEDLCRLGQGKDVVLLCHEAEGKFCHRRLIAEWLEENLKIEVKELGSMKKVEQKLSLF